MVTASAPPAAGLSLLTGQDGLPPLPWLDVSGLLGKARSHALLLHGRIDDGLLMAALGMAQSALCEAPVGARGAGGAACGRCEACRLVQGRGHPDLLLLMPEELRQRWAWPLSGDKPEAAEDSSSRRRPSRQIKIDEVRAAIDWAAVTSSRGRGKWLLLHPAERMNPQAGSALLKTLEEPPAGLRIVLASEDPEALLPTLRSRCQRVRLALPDPAVASRWLDGAGVADAASLLRAAAGRPLLARAWAAEGLDARTWSELPRTLASGEVGPLAGWPLPRVLDAWLHVCHDLWCVALGAAPRYFLPASLPGRIDLEALRAWQAELQRVARAAEHPWSEALLLEALALQARRVMMGDTETADSAARRGSGRGSGLATLRP